MRRSEKEIEDIGAIEEILGGALVCRLGLCDGGRPYVVPLCFGYKERSLYFHCSGEGEKLDILRKNNNVCFEVDIDCEIIKAEKGCDWGMKYRSVIGFGKGVFIEGLEEKREAFDIIMQQYSNITFEYPRESIKNTAVIKVEIESMTGKRSG